MKKIYIIHFVATTLMLNFCILLAGCGGNKPAPEPTPAISTSVSSLTLSAVGDERTFNVTITNAANWTVASSDSWLSVTKQGNNAVQVRSDANLTTASRSANITCNVDGGNVSASVSVSQPKVSDAQSDSLAIIDLIKATGANSALGVEMNTDKRVIALKFPGSKLSGTLPASIGRLTQLQYCDLSGNKLSGAIPAEIGNLTQLTYLDLSDNGFSGNAPSLSQLSGLLVLDMSLNKLTSLPALNANIPGLEYLAFAGNQLSGSLPAGWSAYQKLIYIDLSNNAFTGEIPSAWSVLTSMSALHLYNNTLSNAIPAYLSKFVRLKSLALNNNNLTGSIPVDLGLLPELETLLLMQNRLTGEIPASLLGNPHWGEWENNVCPQQSGYGFSNCNSMRSAKTQVISLSDYGKSIKKLISNNLVKPYS